MRTTDLANYIKERELVRLCKENTSMPRPWSKDQILNTYRFCNVRREDDTVTRWIAANLRNPLANDPNLIPVLCAARLINRVETLEVLKDILLDVGWSPRACTAKLREQRRKGRPIITGAYMIRTPFGMDKIKGLNEVLKPIQKHAERKGFSEDNLFELHAELVKFPCMGSFMAGQVVADAKYVAPYDTAENWATFASSGPGSRRGLNRIMNQPLKQGWDEKEWWIQLLLLRHDLNIELTSRYNKRIVARDAVIYHHGSIGALHAQDVQNNLCEFDKYERARLGEGTPKQRYVPATP